ncbi:MAG: hypothetical protein M3442_09780 [Chloroflexota bacterium]|nr:hypothetical protein [Chloroflexota bacterium]
MPRVFHGDVIIQAAAAAPRVAADGGSVGPPPALAPAAADLHDFDFMFPTLQADPASLLPQSADTPARLKDLGRAMEDPGGPDPGEAAIPAVYTYFGQFVDHDITLEVQPADLPATLSGTMPNLLAPDMIPLPQAQIQNAIRNSRVATLDLDNVYGQGAGVPRDAGNGEKLRIGHVSPLNEPEFPEEKPFLRPPNKGDANDVPRDPRSASDLHDRAALIGDPRNDENTIIAQLHLAFLLAHNVLVDQGHTFEQARTILRQHYQHIVVHDFLKRVADPAIVDDILQNGNQRYDALADPFFLPLEFAVAAYRFGHTMVRPDYNFNINFNLSGEPGTAPANLFLLFTFSALSGQLGFAPTDTDTLPENWVIQWENIVDTRTGAPFGKARRLDTKLAGLSHDNPDLAQGLFRLHDLKGHMEMPPDAARLGVRNLLRGYRLRLPTGQAVAGVLGLPVLTPAQLQAAAASPAQVQALQAGGFLERTPLWYYILAEAKHTVSVPAPLLAANPNIVHQLRVWQQQRRDNNQDPHDYAAFRQHLLAIGAPDPGAQEFVGFRSN